MSRIGDNASLASVLPASACQFASEWFLIQPLPLTRLWLLHPHRVSLLDAGAQWHCLLSQLLAYRKGNADLVDMLACELFDAHGFSGRPCASGLAPDVAVLVLLLWLRVEIHSALLA